MNVHQKSLTLLLCSLSRLYGSEIIQGNYSGKEKTFSHPVSACGYSAKSSFLVGASEIPDDKSFSLSFYIPSGNKFSPMCEEKIKLDGVDDQINPLYGASIQHIGMLGRNPFIVTKQDPSIIYFLHGYKTNRNSLISFPVLDESIQKYPVINIQGIFFSDDQIRALYFAAIVKKENSAFGNEGSAILIGHVKEEVESKNLENANENELELSSQTKITLEHSKIIPLLREPGSHMHEYCYIHVDETLKTVYYGFQIQADNKDTTRVVALTQTSFIDEKKFKKLSPDIQKSITQLPTFLVKPVINVSAVAGDCIVAAQGSGVSISLHTIKTMQTTTRLHYLIVAGGKGTPCETKRKVFALPLINDSDSEYVGMLAKKDAVAHTIFSAKKPYFFLRRIIDEPAVNPGDLYQETDTEARVGGFEELPGDIVDMAIYRDAVYVSVASNPGIVYHSQALFDQAGRIKGWTSWQIAGTCNEPIHNIFIEGPTHELFYCTESDTIMRSRWNYPEALNTILKKRFLALEAGVTAVSFMQHNNTEYILFAGDKKIVGVTYHNGEPQEQFFLDGLQELGTITTFAQVTPGFAASNAHGELVEPCSEKKQLLHPSTTLRMSGGELPVLFVGGQYGLGALFFDGDKPYVKKIYNCTPIKKIIHTQNKLYILTKNMLYASDFDIENINFIPLARASSFSQATFFEDCIISGPLAVLATSSGLYRNCNNSDIQTMRQEMQWQHIPLPEHVGPVTQLFAISPTGNESDCVCAGNGGNLYVLNAHRINDQARIYRFSLKKTDRVEDDTLVPFNDCFVRNKPTFFINAGSYRSKIYTDGAFFFLLNNAYAPAGKTAYAELLNPVILGTGVPFATRASLKIIEDLKSRSLHHFSRNPFNGTMIAAGDFGVMLHE